MKPEVISIDGPAASGKSTVARRVATELGYLYVDSGALYRGVTWQAQGRDMDLQDGIALAGMMDVMDMEFVAEDGAVAFRIDGVAPGLELRTEGVNHGVSPVAAQPEVRRRIVAWLRSLVRFGPLVVEGRDIGTVVFPEAGHKFYLDADAAERARRRHNEMQERREAAEVDFVKRSLERRDRIDSTRKTAPLACADGARVVDSTGMSIDEVVSVILAAIRAQAE